MGCFAFGRSKRKVPDQRSPDAAEPHRPKAAQEEKGKEGQGEAPPTPTAQAPPPVGGEGGGGGATVMLRSSTFPAGPASSPSAKALLTAKSHNSTAPLPLPLPLSPGSHVSLSKDSSSPAPSLPLPSSKAQVHPIHPSKIPHPRSPGAILWPSGSKSHKSSQPPSPATHSPRSPSSSTAPPTPANSSLKHAASPQLFGGAAVPLPTPPQTSPGPKLRRIPSLGEQIPANLRFFSGAELRTATDNFSEEHLLGEGGFGAVYKGYVEEWVPVGGGKVALEKVAVAVKTLNEDGLQGQKEWWAEVNYLGNLAHPRLVRLLGACSEAPPGRCRMLVYEFVANGSLDRHLFEAPKGGALPWLARLRVALDAAQGLVHLHEEIEPPVIFRDFKAANVLLDEALHAKLSDFGLARAGPEGDNTHVSTRVVGTPGYAAPEYVLTGHLTARSDVWSYGVVLLELLTGRRAMDEGRPKEEVSLVDWSRPYLTESRRLFRIMDPLLEGRYSVKGAQKVAALAQQCLQKNPKQRPLMSGVVAALEPLQELTDLACSSPIGSEPKTPTTSSSRTHSSSRIPSGRSGEARASPRPSDHRHLSSRTPSDQFSPSTSSRRSPQSPSLREEAAARAAAHSPPSKHPQLPPGKEEYTAPLVLSLRERASQGGSLKDRRGVALSPLAIGNPKLGRSKSHRGPQSADSRHVGTGMGGGVEGIEARRPATVKTTLQERRGLALSPLSVGVSNGQEGQEKGEGEVAGGNHEEQRERRERRSRKKDRSRSSRSLRAAASVEGEEEADSGSSSEGVLERRKASRGDSGSEGSRRSRRESKGGLAEDTASSGSRSGRDAESGQQEGV